MTTFTQNRYYSNTAAITTLATTGGINNTAVQMVTASQNGWPTTFPFVARIEPSTANEELVLVTSGLGTSASPYNITRAFDGTAAIAHLQGVVVSHGMAQVDLQDTQVHLNLRAANALDQYSFPAHGLPASAWINMAPIQTDSPAGSSTFAFTSIPTNYSHLRIIGQAQSGSNGGLSVTINGDGSIGHYSIITQRNFGVTTGTAVNTAYGASSQSIGYTDSGAFGYLIIDIPFYQQTSVTKILFSECWAFGTTARVTSGQTALFWSIGNPITSLSFTSSAGSFATNSSFALYGIL